MFDLTMPCLLYFEQRTPENLTLIRRPKGRLILLPFRCLSEASMSFA
jgi:hypothetical protein